MAIETIISIGNPADFAWETPWISEAIQDQEEMEGIESYDTQDELIASLVNLSQDRGFGAVIARDDQFLGEALGVVTFRTSMTIEEITEHGNQTNLDYAQRLVTTIENRKRKAGASTFAIIDHIVVKPTDQSKEILLAQLMQAACLEIATSSNEPKPILWIINSQNPTEITIAERMGFLRSQLFRRSWTDSIETNWFFTTTPMKEIQVKEATK